MERGVKRLVLLVLLGLVTACGGGKTAAPSATPTPTPVVVSPTPRPAPAALTVAQARARYLVLVKPGNSAIDNLNKAIKKRPFDWRKARDAAAIVATRQRVFQSQLLTSPWPPKIAATAEKLAEAIANDTVYVRQMGRAKSQGAFLKALEIYNAADTSDVNKYVELLRTQLGLPPAN